MAFKIPNFYSKSPLHGSYYNPKGETYISEVGMIQDAANAVASAGLTIDAKNKQQKDFKNIGKMVDGQLYTQEMYDSKYNPPKEEKDKE